MEGYAKTFRPFSLDQLETRLVVPLAFVHAQNLMDIILVTRVTTMTVARLWSERMITFIVSKTALVPIPRMLLALNAEPVGSQSSYLFQT
jgi:hypothetical protein